MNEYEMPHDDEEEEKVPVLEQLEALYPKDGHGRFTVNTVSEFRIAWGIIDDSGATRLGLEKAYHDPDTEEQIKKASRKAGFGHHHAGVESYIDHKAEEAEEMTQAKADLIHSYIRNTLTAYGLIDEAD